MSGLTLGLMGIDLLDLEILIRSGTASQKRNAQRVMPILRNQHLVLVTLLVWNAVAMEALPIFLDKILGEVGAVLVSVSMVLLFGEIIPQALCKSYGLSIGSKCVWLVRVLQWAAFPISYPVSKVSGPPPLRSRPRPRPRPLAAAAPPPGRPAASGLTAPPGAPPRSCWTSCWGHTTRRCSGGTSSRPWWTCTPSPGGGAGSCRWTRPT